MKKAFVFFFLVLSAAFANAQKFLIVRADSPNAKTIKSITIEPGKTRISSRDNIDWKTVKKVYVVSVDGIERWDHPSGVDKKNTKNKDSGSEDNIIMRLFHFGAVTFNLQGRGALIEPIPGALSVPDKSESKIIFEGRNKFLFNQSQYPQIDGAKFFVQIESQGKTTKHILQTNKDTLYISHADLASDVTDTDATYELGYFNPNAITKVKPVASFEPYFAGDNETANLVSGLIGIYSDEHLSEDVLRNKIYSTIYITFGKPNSILFYEIFDHCYRR